MLFLTPFGQILRGHVTYHFKFDQWFSTDTLVFYIMNVGNDLPLNGRKCGHKCVLEMLIYSLHVFQIYTVIKHKNMSHFLCIV